MGQLLNRLIRFAKSQVNDTNYHSYRNIDNPEDDLKKVIEELNNPKSQEYKHQSSQKKNYSEQTRNESININTAFQIIGIKNNSTVDEIKSAYKQKLKEYHPDKVANLGMELKVLAEKKTKEINESYEIIRKYKGF